MKSGRFSTTDIDAVRESADIVDVISQYIALRRSGASWKGLCPFHDEKTPSFSVNPTTSTFHCFGCDEHGDVIDFVARQEGEGFRWAVESLAQANHVTLRYDNTDIPGTNYSATHAARDRLIAANAAAAELFAEQLLHEDDAAAARLLLATRGFDIEDAVNRFGCGYVPRNGIAVVAAHLRNQGFTADEIVDAGLATRNDIGRLRDKFRGRLTWTIHNTHGRPIGFGARRLHADDAMTAKFLNTSETSLYRKSAVLYGFHSARTHIAKARQAIIVEGYTDCMAFRAAGIDNVVATCGTAFTPAHLGLLRRIVGDAGELVFAMDDDAAGRKASITIFETTKASNIRRLSALPSSGGRDPDELRQDRGNQALRDLLAERRPLLKVTIANTLATLPTATAEDKTVALDAILPILADVADPLLRAEYAAYVAQRLDIAVHHAQNRLGTTLTRPAPADATPTYDSAKNWVEREVMRILIQHEPAARHYLYTVDPLAKTQAARCVIAALRQAIDTEANGSTWPLHVYLSASDDDARSVIEALLAQGLPAEGRDIDDYADELVTRLAGDAVDRMIDDVRQELADASTPEQKRAALEALADLIRTRDHQ